MKTLLCRTRVSEFSKWKAVFDSHAEAHRDAGLHLEHIWRSLEEPNNIFFLFEVTDVEAANAFLHSPESAEAGDASGVLDGEYHFLESAPGY